jgi:hypothetical protein
LVNIFPHNQEALIRLANARKRIEEGVREVIDDTLRLFWSRWMCNMLVHYDVLEDNEHTVFLQKTMSVPIPSTQKMLGQGCCAGG